MGVWWGWERDLVCRSERISEREGFLELMLRAIFIPKRTKAVEEWSILRIKWPHKLDASVKPVTETKQEGGLAKRGM